MRHAFAFILISLTASLLGIGSAWFVLQGDLRFDKVAIGQWEVWPTAGEPHANPYTKAYLARTGSTWMGTIEGLAFFAKADRNGAPLLSNCTYQMDGKVPRGRLWTLSSMARKSSQTTPRYNINFITSHDVIWKEDESLQINISKTAQPNNWLPLTTSGTFILALRIYDTPLTSGALDAAIETPIISKSGCS